MEPSYPLTVPPLLVDFLLTVAMSFLIGLGLREYYLANYKTHIFGSTRTCTFIGIWGFVLFLLQEERWLYVAGLMILGALLGIVALFSWPIFLALLPAFLALATSAGIAVSFLQRGRLPVEPVPPAEKLRNPLELSSALSFALLFVVLSAATHLILAHYARRGLQWMSFFTGFTDIDPFVLALLQGDFSAPHELIARSIFIATASNNLLKAGYAWTWSTPFTGRLAGMILLVLAGLTLGYGLFA